MKIFDMRTTYIWYWSMRERERERDFGTFTRGLFGWTRIVVLQCNLCDNKWKVPKIGIKKGHVQQSSLNIVVKYSKVEVDSFVVVPTDWTNVKVLGFKAAALWINETRKLTSELELPLCLLCWNLRYIIVQTTKLSSPLKPDAKFHCVCCARTWNMIWSTPMFQGTLSIWG